MSESFEGIRMKCCAKGHRLMYVLLLGTIAGAIAACGGPSTPTSPNGAIAAIEGLTATVEPITSPGTGWLYRLTYRVHETGGKTGATLTATHFALSNGFSVAGNFSGRRVVPRVSAHGTLTIESDLSVVTTAPAASHVVFTITYTDDNSQTSSASAAADISPVTP
jgi:hypothetical protein